MKAALVMLIVLSVFGTVSAQTTTGISQEVWANATLMSLNDLANNPNLLGIPTKTASLSNFQQSPQNLSGKFVARYMARLIPPTSGNYTFWVAANQFAKVWLTATGDFANQNYLCQMTQAVAPMSGQYTKYPEQKSSAIPLVAGQIYYMLVVQFESGDSVNHMAVGWQLPNGTYERPIPGVTASGVVRLRPYSYPASSSLTASPTTIASGQSSLLTWIARNVATCAASANPPDAKWSGTRAVSGNQSVTPSVSTVYYLYCDGLTVSASVTVQTTSANPRYVQFDPSPDHSEVGQNNEPVVARYDLSFYLSGAVAPFSTVSLGKPSPGGDGKILVDFSGMLIAWPLAIGNYQARVSAVGPLGLATSEPSNIFTYVR